MLYQGKSVLPALACFQGLSLSAALIEFLLFFCACSKEPPARVELARLFNTAPPGRGESLGTGVEPVASRLTVARSSQLS